MKTKTETHYIVQPFKPRRTTLDKLTKPKLINHQKARSEIENRMIEKELGLC